MDDWNELAGRTLMVGIPAPTLDGAVRRRLESLRPGGVILFARNLESHAQTRRLLSELLRMLPDPTLLAVDQEGGRVSRLQPWIGATPSAAALARGGDEMVRSFGRANGEALRALGFNLDFAPVVDLCDAEAPNGIADRSFGTDPRRVVRLASAWLKGLQSTGVAGCLKHFPGLGDTRVDSHLELPTVERDRERLRAEDLLPYRALGAEAACVMVGHGHYPALTPGEPIPATCSAAIVDGLLRKELGFDGLVVSDDLLMGAISGRDVAGAAAVEVLCAGCDLLLYCDELDRAEAALSALAAAARRDADVARRLREAAASVVRTAGRWPAAAGDEASWKLARRRFDAFSGMA